MALPEAARSSLAAALLEVAAARGDHAALVGDDRVALETHGGRLIAFPHPAIAGLIEQRGRGIVAVDHAPAAVIRLVVDLVPHPLPCRSACPIPRLVSRLLGVSVAWLVLPAAEGCAAQALQGAGVVAILAILRITEWFKRLANRGAMHKIARPRRQVEPWPGEP